MAANGFDDDQTRSFTNLAAGTIVSHYRIISKIGAGGMGEVYLAEDTQLDRKVALKFLPPHLSQDEAARARFTREAKAAAKLDHPNIVPVYEVGEFQGRPFFAMAHIEGKSLKEVIKEGKLSINQAIELTKQICEGLHKAHESGVVHRDIKPGNIIIDNDNKARILDFGLATVAGGDKLTRTGSTLGTVGYMSPEQIEGKKVDHRSDLFSVGVILYEMLTGRRPFEGDTDAAVARSITDSTPEPVARYKSGTTGALQQIIDKALTKDPSLRYQHADGMLADLKRLALVSTSSRKIRIGLWVGLTVIVIVAGVLLKTIPWTERSESREPQRIMLAVLPFQNLGDAGDESFADGITEEITSRLGMIRELGVISRTSAMQYKNTKKSLPQIANELNVDYVLEGTIRWDITGDTDIVRITPQLISAAENTHVWTEIYEEEMTSVFQIQGDIASDIAAALDITLVDSVRKAMESPSTDNMSAYTAYLRALEYDRMPGNNTNNLDRAILMFEQAIQLDSNFALAWAGLSYCQIDRYRIARKSTRRLDNAKEAADRSLIINPNLGEGHLALGYYYLTIKQLDKAHRELELAEKYRPSLARIYDKQAMVLENQHGFTTESLNEALRAIELDPLDGHLLTSIAQMYYYRRDMDKLIEYMDRAIELRPDEPAGYILKAYMLTESGYDLEEARKLFRHPVCRNVGWNIKYALDVEIASRNYDLALAMLDTCEFKIPEQKGYFRKKRAWVTWLKGDTILARSIYDSIRTELESALKMENRDNEIDFTELSLCYAVLGQKDKAINSAKRALESAAGLMTGTLDRKADLARTYTLIGEYDKAVGELEEVLSVPNKLGVSALKVHPEWDPLRDHPRFQALIEKYE